MAESHTIQVKTYISVIIHFIFVKFSDGFTTYQDKFYDEEGVLVCNHGTVRTNGKKGGIRGKVGFEG